MTKEEVLKVLVLIESVYSTCVIKNDIVLHWFKICSDLDYEGIMEKVYFHSRQSPYPPSLQELVDGLNLGGNIQTSVNCWMHEYSIR